MCYTQPYEQDFFLKKQRMFIDKLLMRNPTNNSRV